MSWRVLWSGPWNTLSQPAIYSFVGRLIQRKLIKLCAKWLEEKEASKGFLHSNSVFIMTLKHACNILEVPLHLLFISVLRSVLNFPFAFPPTAFHCYSSPFSPSSNSSASSVSFQSHFLVIRFFFDVFFFLFILIRRLFCCLRGLTATHCGGSSICFPLRGRLLNIWRLKLIHII